MEQRPEVLQAADRIINFCFFFAIDDVYYKMIGGAEMTHDVSAIQTILSPVFDSYDISRAVLLVPWQKVRPQITVTWI